MTSRSSAAFSWIFSGQFEDVYADTNVLAAFESEQLGAFGLSNPGSGRHSQLAMLHIGMI